MSDDNQIDSKKTLLSTRRQNYTKLGTMIMNNGNVNAGRKKKSFCMNEELAGIDHQKAKTLWKKLKKRIKIINFSTKLRLIDLDELNKAERFIISDHKKEMKSSEKCSNWIKIKLFHFKKYWDMAVSLVTICLLVILPIRLCFNVKHDNFTKIELIGDATFFLDSIFHFLYNPDLIHNEEQLLKIKFKELITLSSTFQMLIRCIASLPFQLIYSHFIYAKLFRITEIPRFYKLLDHLFWFIIIRFFRGNSNFLNNSLIVTKCLVTFFLISHSFACLNIGLAIKHINTSWIPVYDTIGNKPDLNDVDMYIQSLYFTIYTFSTVGYTNVEPIYRWTGEYLNLSAMQIIGILLYSDLRVTLLIINMKARQLERIMLSGDKEQLNWIIRINSQREIKNLSEELWKDIKLKIVNGNMNDEIKVFKDFHFYKLPTDLKWYLLNTIFGEFLSIYRQIFKGISQDFIFNILLILRIKTFDKDYILLDENKFPYGIIFIKQGHIEKIYKKSKQVKPIKEIIVNQIFFVESILENPKPSKYEYKVSKDHRLNAWYLPSLDYKDIKENYYAEALIFQKNIKHFAGMNFDSIYNHPNIKNIINADKNSVLLPLNPIENPSIYNYMDNTLRQIMLKDDNSQNMQLSPNISFFNQIKSPQNNQDYSELSNKKLFESIYLKELKSSEYNTKRYNDIDNLEDKQNNVAVPDSLNHLNSTDNNRNNEKFRYNKDLIIDLYQSKPLSILNSINKNKELDLKLDNIESHDYLLENCSSSVIKYFKTNTSKIFDRQKKIISPSNSKKDYDIDDIKFEKIDDDYMSESKIKKPKTPKNFFFKLYNTNNNNNDNQYLSITPSKNEDNINNNNHNIQDSPSNFHHHRHNSPSIVPLIKASDKIINEFYEKNNRDNITANQNQKTKINNRYNNLDLNDISLNSNGILSELINIQKKTNFQDLENLDSSFVSPLDYLEDEDLNTVEEFLEYIEKKIEMLNIRMELFEKRIWFQTCDIIYLIQKHKKEGI